MKQAILIIAHNHLWTLKQILKSLDSEFFDFYIMIDKKSNIELNDLKNSTQISNIKCWKNIEINWGGTSQARCEIELLKKAIENKNYNYFHLISGNDFPIKSAKEIYDFFKSKYPLEFVNFESKDLQDVKKEFYYYKNFFMNKYKKNIVYKIANKVLLKLQKIFKLKINENIDFKVGCNWFSITDEFAKYLIEKENWVINTYRYSRSSDESFVQTILYNSEFINKLYNNKFDNDFDACKRLIDWNRGNPYTFKSSDYNEIINSKAMFVRKVNEDIDKDLIIKLEKKLFNEIQKNEG